MFFFYFSFSISVLRNIFLVSCVLLACSALFPVLWHLWIYAGSANSNFYYAITLLFNFGQVKRPILTPKNNIDMLINKSFMPSTHCRILGCPRQKLTNRGWFLWSWLLNAGPTSYRERCSKMAVVTVLRPKIVCNNFLTVSEM